jgi:HupE/UreJ protein
MPRVRYPALMGISSEPCGDLAACLRRAAVLLAALLAGAIPLGAAAHDIPADVKLTAFVKPLDQRLELLVRVPLAALIEVDYPRRGSGALDLRRAQEALLGATKLYLTDNITVYENEMPLAAPRVARARVSLAADPSFGSYAQARAHMDEPPLADNLELTWNQQFLDVLLEYPIRSERSAFALRWRVDRFGINVSTDLRVLLPGGATRSFAFLGDPGLLRLDPRWSQAAQQFFTNGFWYFLQGVDHLLFLLCLVLPFRRPRTLALIVTSFAVGILISQLAAVPDAPWFPPLIETLTAASMVYLGLENIVHAAQRRPAGAIARRWMLAFGFGLLQGYGYSLALRETLQYAGEHLLTALLAFNAGIGLAQFALLMILVPALGLAWRYVVADWLGIVILSAFATATAWDWMLARGKLLAKFPLPNLDAAFLANALTAALAALMLAGGVWLASGWLGRWIAPECVAPARSPGARRPRAQGPTEWR